MAKSMISCLRVAGVGTVLVGVLAGTGVANAPVASAAAVACVSPGGPGRGYNASVGNRQNGETVCIRVGEKLLVSLFAPAQTSLLWRHVHVSPPGVLAVAAVPTKLVPGVTTTAFVAAHRGTADLSSQRPACSPPPKSSLSCGAPLRWRVTVVVAGRRPGN